jgi:hypothetical protein
MAEVTFAEAAPALPPNGPKPAEPALPPVASDSLNEPAPADPLAAINSLSDEERLALFT